MGLPNRDRYLTLNSMASAAVVERGVLERMLFRGLITADAELKFGEQYVPLFLESRAVEVLLKRGTIEQKTGTLPSRRIQALSSTSPTHE